MAEDSADTDTYRVHIQGVLEAIKTELAERDAHGIKPSEASESREERGYDVATDNAVPVSVGEDMEGGGKPGHRQEGLAQLLVPLALGTARSFNFQALVSERRRHETKEATSAIAYRYNNALAMGVLNSLREPGPGGHAEAELSGGDSAKLKASLVSQITRVMSAERVAGTAGVKDDGRAEASGVERHLRWQGGGRVGGAGTVTGSVGEETPSSNRGEQYQSLLSWHAGNTY